jgi:hypothetical protein
LRGRSNLDVWAFGAYIESEHAKWAKVVKDSGAKID